MVSMPATSPATMSPPFDGKSLTSPSVPAPSRVSAPPCQRVTTLLPFWTVPMSTAPFADAVSANRGPGTFALTVAFSFLSLLVSVTSLPPRTP